jgi:hypothetical protein
MEADWTLALAAGDPVIAVPWAASNDVKEKRRFVHLRVAPHRIHEVEEASAHPPLRSALLRLNGASSHLWTAKCDAWTTGPETGDAPFDPYEMDAEPGTTAYGAGCYIDVLARKEPLFTSFADQKHWMEKVVNRLRATPATCMRVELVMRPAEVDETAGFGLTCFIEGCGPNAEMAGQRWAEALGMTLAVLMDTPHESSLRNDTMTGTGE